MLIYIICIEHALNGISHQPIPVRDTLKRMVQIRMNTRGGYVILGLQPFPLSLHVKSTFARTRKTQWLGLVLFSTRALCAGSVKDIAESLITTILSFHQHPASE